MEGSRLVSGGGRRATGVRCWGLGWWVSGLGWRVSCLPWKLVSGAESLATGCMVIEGEVQSLRGLSRRSLVFRP